MGLGDGVWQSGCVVEWVGDGSGRRLLILDLEFLGKNFLKYKLQISLYVFISKAMWYSGKKRDTLDSKYRHCHLLCGFTVT